MDLKRRFKENLEKIYEKNDRFVLGVSGGMDSMTLLYLMADLLPKENLLICHLNHLYRGEDAYRDERFVKDQAEKLGVEIRIKRASMEERAKEDRVTVEEAGRELRREFFEESLKNFSAKRIITAHHADDQVETILMNIIRGSGIKGLTGMKMDDGLYFKPLLTSPLDEIREFAEENEIPFKEDYTNSDPSFGRNRVRLKLIPYLEDYNPRVKKNIYEMGDSLKEDWNLIRKHLDREEKALIRKEGKGLFLDRECFLKEEDQIKRYILRDIIDSFTGLDGFGRVQTDQFFQVAKMGVGKKALWKDLIMEVSYDSLIFYREEKREKIGEKILLKEGENDLSPYGKIILSHVKYKDVCFEKNSYYFDQDQLSGSLYCRNRLPGDLFQPYGMEGKKKLKDFFIDQKIAQKDRDSCLLLLDNKDILLICSIRRSNKAPINEDTKNIIKIKYIEE